MSVETVVYTGNREADSQPSFKSTDTVKFNYCQKRKCWILAIKMAVSNRNAETCVLFFRQLPSWLPYSQRFYGGPYFYMTVDVGRPRRLLFSYRHFQQCSTPVPIHNLLYFLLRSYSSLICLWWFSNKRWWWIYCDICTWIKWIEVHFPSSPWILLSCCF